MTEEEISLEKKKFELDLMKRKSSRAWLVIKIFTITLVIMILYCMTMGALMPDEFKDHFSFYLSIGSILSGSIGAWLGVNEYNKKK